MSKDIGDDELDDILDGALEAFEETGVDKPQNESESSKPIDDGYQKESASSDEAPPEVTEEAAKAFEEALKALGDFGLDQGEEADEVNEADMKLVEEFMSSLGTSLGGLGVPGAGAATNQPVSETGTGHDRQSTVGNQSSTGAGGVPDVEKLVESIVGHLLSEDVLKSPMLQMRAAYAEWLPKNAEKLSVEELGRYSKQQELVEQICDRYEQGAESSAIMELLSKMQETGAPPAEVMKGLSDNSDNSEGGSLPGAPPAELDKMLDSCGVQ